MDISVIFLDNGNPQTIIDYYSNSYSVPKKDEQQDWILHKSKSKIIQEMYGDQQELTNVTEFHFSRKIENKDSKVKNFN